MQTGEGRDTLREALLQSCFSPVAQALPPFKSRYAKDAEYREGREENQTRRLTQRTQSRKEKSETEIEGVKTTTEEIREKRLREGR